MFHSVEDIVPPKSKYGTPRWLHGLIGMKLKADNQVRNRYSYHQIKTENRMLKMEKRSGNCKHGIEAEIQVHVSNQKTKQNNLKN